MEKKTTTVDGDIDCSFFYQIFGMLFCCHIFVINKQIHAVWLKSVLNGTSEIKVNFVGLVYSFCGEGNIFR